MKKKLTTNGRANPAYSEGVATVMDIPLNEIQK